MPTRRFRRKYQTGGSVIPSFQGAQVLGRPQVINPQVNPIVFDPSSTFQAQSQRQQSLRTAMEQARLSQSERRDVWQKELQNRNFLYNRLDKVMSQMQNGMDKLTQLDMNIPEQFKLSQDIKRNLDQINEESASLLSDNSLSPQERLERLREQATKAQGLFTNPEYIKHVQNNKLAERVYSDMTKAASSGDNLIDFESATNNIDLARRLQQGQIDRGLFFQNLKNFTLDSRSVDAREKQIDNYIRDALDPDKALTNWERYQDDDDFLVFQEKFRVPDLESQVDVVFDLYKSDENWMKVQEARGNRSFLDENGFVDDEKLRDHVRRKVQLIRGSLTAEGKEIVTDIDINRRPSRRGGGTSGGGRARTQAERQNEIIRSSLNDMGYEIIDPSILSQLNSAAEVQRILNTPDEKLVDSKGRPDIGEINFKRDLENSIRKKPDNQQNQGDDGGRIPIQLDQRSIEEIITGPAPINFTEAMENANLELDNNGFLVHNTLVPGDNNGVVPQVLGGVELGYYTNNPFNIKGRDSVPVIKRFDRSLENPEADTVFHRVFPTFESGFAAGMDVINKYKLGQNSTFNAKLNEKGKSLQDATIEDMYVGVYAEGGTRAHAEKIAKTIGVTADTKISDIPTEQLAMGILSVENPKIYNSLMSSNPSNVTQEVDPEEVSDEQRDDAINTTSKIQVAFNDIASLQDAKENLLAFSEDAENDPAIQSQIKELDKEISKVGKSIESEIKPYQEQIKIDRAKQIAVENVLAEVNAGGSYNLGKQYSTVGLGERKVRASDGEPVEYLVTSGNKVIGIYSEEGLIEYLSNFNLRRGVKRKFEEEGLLDVSLEDIQNRINTESGIGQPKEKVSTEKPKSIKDKDKDIVSKYYN